MRISLGAHGDPIPEFALPDAFLDPDFPIVTFELDNGELFSAADYLGLGYTNFEVFCVGAAGGYGSEGWTGLNWPVYSLGGVTHWKAPILANRFGYLTPPGGGGLQRVVGYLADLDDEVPVVVGVAGTDGPKGHIDYPTPYQPFPNEEITFDNEIVSPAGVDPGWPGNGHIYDLPHPTFPITADGGNGGASSFGGTVCRASGGKGGQKSVVSGPWLPATEWNTRTPLGHGGEGGKGGQTTVGGGGAGSSGGVSGEDGTYDGEIGEGGGGGRGGYWVPASAIQPGVSAEPRPELYAEATSGGRGSFAFGDTSVFGEGQSRGGANLYAKYLNGGAGGGAKIPGAAGQLKVGSRTPGYLPTGAVVVRISKVA